MTPEPIISISDPRWVRAIAHPLRLRLLAMLDEEPSSPVVLAGKLRQSLGTVSYHVRTLYDLGLLDLVSTRQRRGATEHIYKARTHPRFTDEAWEELGTVPKQRMISAVLNQIHDYASRSAAAGGFDRADAQFSRKSLKLDQEGWSELAQASKTWLQETVRIERDAAERLAEDPGAAFDAGLVILFFEALPFSAEPPLAGQGPQVMISR
ncbi:MAG: helix-turn-helix domain-containing protein [Solirubrobacteraceae bacterium]